MKNILKKFWAIIATFVLLVGFLARTVSAQAVSPVFVDLSFDAPTNTFTVSANSDAVYPIEYLLSYSKPNNTIAGITGSDVTSFTHAGMYAGSCSTGTCIPDGVVRALIKFKADFGGGNWEYLAMRYENGTTFNFVYEDNGNNILTLTDEETAWLLGGPLPTVTPTPTPTPTATPTDAPTQNNNSGSSASAPVCNSTTPSSAPVLHIAPNGANSALLNWTAINPTTHYMIRYGTKSGNYIYGAPNVGNVTSFTVNLLSSGTTYYFQVAAVNNCMPGPWSNEVSTRPTGTVFPSSAPAQGFTQTTLGASTETTPTATATASATPTSEPIILSSDTKAIDQENGRNWILLIIVIILGILFFLFFARRRKKN